MGTSGVVLLGSDSCCIWNKLGHTGALRSTKPGQAASSEEAEGDIPLQEDLQEEISLHKKKKKIKNEANSKNNWKRKKKNPSEEILWLMQESLQPRIPVAR